MCSYIHIGVIHLSDSQCVFRNVQISELQYRSYSKEFLASGWAVRTDKKDGITIILRRAIHVYNVAAAQRGSSTWSSLAR